MAECRVCGRGVLRVTLGDGATVLLDERARCFAPLADGDVEDGARAFLSGARVEHSAVCPGAPPARRQGKRRGESKTEAPTTGETPEPHEDAA